MAATNKKWFVLPGLMSDLLTREKPFFRRIKTENISIAQSYIVRGFGFIVQWFVSLASGERIYAEFTIPTGYYMSLDYRELNPEADHVFYRVYPEGTYTVDTVGVEVPVRQLRPDAGLTFSGVMNEVTLTVGEEPDEANDWIVQVPAYGEAGGGTGNKSTGALSSDNIFRLLPPGAKFLLELADDGAGSTEAQLTLAFAFIPESLVPEADV